MSIYSLISSIIYVNIFNNYMEFIDKKYQKLHKH